MEIIGLVGIVVAIIAIILMSVKGLNIVIAAPLATLIIILTNKMDIFGSLVGKEQSYMVGLSNFLISNFAIFLLGSILAQYMEKSNATVSIANFILAKVGMENPYVVLVAIAAIGALLTYGGISLFVVMFAIIPLAKPIFKKLDINWELFPIPLFLGMATFTMSMLPGTPSIQNAVPTTALGTTLTAAPLISIIGTVVIIVFGLIYMKLQLNKSIKNNEGFDSYLEGAATGAAVEAEALDESSIPGIWVSLLPILALVAVILVFSKVPNIILIALTVAILLCAVLFNKYIPGQKILLSNGAVRISHSGFLYFKFGSVRLCSDDCFRIRDHQKHDFEYPWQPDIRVSRCFHAIGRHNRLLIGRNRDCNGDVRTNLFRNGHQSRIDPQSDSSCFSSVNGNAAIWCCHHFQ